jgi:hypothetical protein
MGCESDLTTFEMPMLTLIDEAPPFLPDAAALKSSTHPVQSSSEARRSADSFVVQVESLYEMSGFFGTSSHSTIRYICSRTSSNLESMSTAFLSDRPEVVGILRVITGVKVQKQFTIIRVKKYSHFISGSASFVLHFPGFGATTWV